jgi:hypothetical protein
MHIPLVKVRNTYINLQNVISATFSSNKEEGDRLEIILNGTEGKQPISYVWKGQDAIDLKITLDVISRSFNSYVRSEKDRLDIMRGPSDSIGS